MWAFWVTLGKVIKFQAKIMFFLLLLSNVKMGQALNPI